MEITTKDPHFAFQLSLNCGRGPWQKWDRERISTHLAAHSYAVVLDLPSSADVSVLDGILSHKDISTVSEAPSVHAHVMNVAYA